MDWRERSELTDDVAFFTYSSPTVEKRFPEVFVWDLDKTYLDTSIHSLGGLFMTAMERALSKRNVPATNVLLNRLGSDWKSKQSGQFPLYFITASPPQMEERIIEKFALDGITPVGCFFKDNLRNLSPKRFWRLTKQVGYKLQALLLLRSRLAEQVQMTLWGDDSESDAIIYNLFSDICARRLSPTDLRSVLKSLSVLGEQVDRILHLQAALPEFDPVQKIYINLAVDTDSDYYLKFGRRTVPTENTWQIALDLLQDNRLSLEDCFLIAQDMIYKYDFTPETLLESFDHMIRRAVLGQKVTGQIIAFFQSKNLIPHHFRPSLFPAEEIEWKDGRVTTLKSHSEPWINPNIDYLHDHR